MLQISLSIELGVSTPPGARVALLPDECDFQYALLVL